MLEHRGEYSSWEGARAVLEKEGYGDLTLKQNEPYLLFTGNSLISYAKYRSITKDAKMDYSLYTLNPYREESDYKIYRQSGGYAAYTLVTSSLDLTSLREQIGEASVSLKYEACEAVFVEDYLTQSIFYDGDFFSYEKAKRGEFERREVSDPASFRFFDERLVITDGVDLVPEGAFAEFPVSSVQIASLRSVPEGAFRNCAYLERVEFPTNLQTIEAEAFSGCRSLFELSFEEGLTSVGSCAFKDCKALNRLFLPKSLTVISETAFMGADGITCVNYGGTKEAYRGISGAIPAFSGRILRYEGNSYTSGYNALTLDEEKKTFVSDGYLGQNRSVTVQAIYRKGENTYLSAGVSEGAYAYDTFLRHLTLQEGLPSIGAFAFYRTAVSTVSLCDSVRFVGEGAFSDCYRLESISVSAGNPSFVSVDGVLFSLHEGEATLLVYPSGRRERRYEVPSSVEKNGVSYPVTKIRAHSFENPLYTSKIYIPEGIVREEESLIGVEAEG